MSYNISLPSRFIDDHAERDLPTPRILKRTTRLVQVSADDPALPSLLADAKARVGDIAERGTPLQRSARQTVGILCAHGIQPSSQ